MLKRTDEDEGGQPSEQGEIQSEFNGGYRSSSRQTGRSRASYATYNTQRTSSPYHGDVPTLRPPVTSSPSKRPVSTDPDQGTTRNRFSSMLRSSSAMGGSFSSRFSRVSSAQEAVSYEEPNNSATDLSRELVEANERDADRLLDVRACCDGKHYFIFNLNDRNLRFHRQTSCRSTTLSFFQGSSQQLHLAPLIHRFSELPLQLTR